MAESNSDDEQVGHGTVFEYHLERHGLGGVLRGVVCHGDLVGTRGGDRLDFRYVDLDFDGVASTGPARP